MSLHKRVKGDFIIESVGLGNTITMHEAGGITIDGDLTVTGAQTTVESTNSAIVDNEIVLNSGETLDGVAGGAGTAGIIIDRGIAANGDAGIRFNESTNSWEIKNGDGVGWQPIAYGSVGINNVVEDLTPQLGGNLDVNGQSIVSITNGDIVLAADGTGAVQIDSDIMIKEQAGDETPLASYNKLYAKAVGPGGSGLFFSNLSETDELVSKKKAIVYGIIF